MNKIVTLCILLFLIAGCSDKAALWSEAEKENAQHLFYSLESSIAATALSNAIGRGNQPKSRMAEVVSLRRVALTEASLVKDSVLQKANKELPEKFRSLFQKSLEYFIQAYEEKDNQASMRYSVLAEQWGDWYQKNKRYIRIPK